MSEKTNTEELRYELPEQVLQGAAYVAASGFQHLVRYASSEETSLANDIFKSVMESRDEVRKEAAALLADLDADVIANLPGDLISRLQSASTREDLEAVRQEFTGAVEAAIKAARVEREHEMHEEEEREQLRAKRDAYIDEHFKDPKLKAYVQAQADIISDANATEEEKEKAKANLRKVEADTGISVQPVIDMSQEMGNSRDQNNTVSRSFFDDTPAVDPEAKRVGTAVARDDEPKKEATLGLTWEMAPADSEFKAPCAVPDKKPVSEGLGLTP